MIQTELETRQNMNDYDMEVAVKVITESLDWLNSNVTRSLEIAKSSDSTEFEVAAAGETVVQHDMFRRITEAVSQIRQLEKTRKILSRVIHST